LRQQQVALDVIVMLKGMQQALDRRLALARAGEVVTDEPSEDAGTPSATQITATSAAAPTP
jgi:hypothetical protein